jgi:hypothetical protein
MMEANKRQKTRFVGEFSIGSCDGGEGYVSFVWLFANGEDGGGDDYQRCEDVFG